MGKKCADLVSLSTITHIVSFPFLVLGNLVIRSMVTISHFHVGSSGCCSKPDGFLCSALTCAHVKHLAT
ncbi:hypothetical protein HanIR_Chr07g0341491 [Helianthus annuus]|nr:hypothetical protein HanIR_Chr07g0341491 [Helianthus annuus]